MGWRPTWSFATKETVSNGLFLRHRSVPFTEMLLLLLLKEAFIAEIEQIDKDTQLHCCRASPWGRKRTWTHLPWEMSHQAKIPLPTVTSVVVAGS